MDSRNLWAVVGVFLIACLFVSGITLTGSVDEQSTPLITTILGFASIIILALMNGNRAEKAVKEVDTKVDRVLNGEMDKKIAAVVHAVLDERSVGSATERERESLRVPVTDTPTDTPVETP